MKIDERAGERGKDIVDVASAFVACDEPIVSLDLSKGALDDSPVLPERLAGLDAAPGNPRSDPAMSAGLDAAAMAVGLVGVKLVWPALRPARLAIDRRDTVEQFLEGQAVFGSLVSALVRKKASGIPLLSVIKWRFVPSLPLSIWFGPVLSPPFLPQVTRYPCTRGFKSTVPARYLGYVVFMRKPFVFAEVVDIAASLIPSSVILDPG